MLHHRTTDPAKRATHITNREFEQLEREAISRDPLNYAELWPQGWLTLYHSILPELVFTPMEVSLEVPHS